VDPIELESLPTEWFKFIQVSDVAPGIPDYQEGMIEIARYSRLYPGEGCINFADIIEKLPTVDYCIELPNKNRLAELGYEEHARRCIKAAKNSFEKASQSKSKAEPITD
jgi:sugar phosphate isomerase/epimerase